MLRDHPLPKPLSVVHQVFHDTLSSIKDGQILMVAASLAYTTILSLIPLLAVSFSIFQAFGGMEKLYKIIEPFIIENLAENTSEEAIHAIRGFLSNIHAGAIGVGGLIGLIITCMSMLLSAENAINRVWKVPPSRTMFQRIASYWLFITLGPLALSIAVGAATSSQNFPISKLLPGGTGIFVITVLIFYFIYKYVPNKKVRKFPALIAGTLTAVIWNLARISYAIYTQKFVSYNKIYGSLAAVPILLLWIYIIWLILLTGAALTAAIQKRQEVQ